MVLGSPHKHHRIYPVLILSGGKKKKKERTERGLALTYHVPCREKETKGATEGCGSSALPFAWPNGREKGSGPSPGFRKGEGGKKKGGGGKRGRKALMVVIRPHSGITGESGGRRSKGEEKGRGKKDGTRNLSTDPPLVGPRTLSFRPDPRSEKAVGTGGEEEKAGRGEFEYSISLTKRFESEGGSKTWK